MSDLVEFEIHFGGGTDRSAPWVSLMPITISLRPSALAAGVDGGDSAFFGEGAAAQAQAKATSETRMTRICRAIVLVSIPDQELALDRLEVPEGGGLAEVVVPQLVGVGQVAGVAVAEDVDEEEHH